MIDCVCECTRVNVFACGPVHACVRACLRAWQHWRCSSRYKWCDVLVGDFMGKVTVIVSPGSTIKCIFGNMFMYSNNIY